jgi:hypothetical protein
MSFSTINSLLAKEVISSKSVFFDLYDDVFAVKFLTGARGKLFGALLWFTVLESEDVVDDEDAFLECIFFSRDKGGILFLLNGAVTDADTVTSSSSI